MELTSLGTEREGLLKHLTRTLSYEVFLEFATASVHCTTITDTTLSFSRHYFLNIEPSNYPFGKVVYLRDKEIVKEFKSLLKRKSAEIYFEDKGDHVSCLYSYKQSIIVEPKTETQKAKREQVIKTGEIQLPLLPPD